MGGPGATSWIVGLVWPLLRRHNGAMRSVAGSGRLWWVGGVAFAFGLAGVLTFFAFGSAERLDRADKLASVGGLVIGAMALLVSIIALTRAWQGSRYHTAAAVLLERAVVDLGEQVRRQWLREMTVRLLNRPQPLRVRWSSTGRPVAAHANEILDGAMAGRPTRLRLHGDITGVAAAFAQLPARQLVVLGQPGAGKTVLALHLTVTLLQHRTPNQPVPVLLALSSWNPHEPLDAWLIRRITEDYPFLANAHTYGPNAAAHLVWTQRILPVLDGLDEMPTAQHPSAVAALNDAIAGARPIVLTCRSDEYQAAVAATGTPLARAAVVEIEPVAATDLAIYLPAGQIDGHTKWAPVTGRLRACPDGPLAKALSTPLMAYLARTMYTRPGSHPAELCHTDRLTDRNTIENHLLNGYLPAIYQPQPATAVSSRDDGYTADQARRWLSFLARHLARLNTHDLAWWQLPLAIPHRRVLFSLVFTLVAMVVFIFLTALQLVVIAIIDIGISRDDLLDWVFLGALLLQGGPMVGLVAGLIASRAEATIPGPHTSWVPGPPVWRGMGAALAYGSVSAVGEVVIADPVTTESIFFFSVVPGVAFGLLISLIPRGITFTAGRRPQSQPWRIGHDMLAGLLIGLAAGSIDMLLLAFGSLWRFASGVAAGLTIVGLANTSKTVTRTKLLTRQVIRGLAGAIALWLLLPPNALWLLLLNQLELDVTTNTVALAFGIAVGVGITIPRADNPTTRPLRLRAHRVLHSARQAFVFALILGPVSLLDASGYLDLSSLSVVLIYGLMVFVLVWLVVAGDPAAFARQVQPPPTKWARAVRQGTLVGLASGLSILVISIPVFREDPASVLMIGAVAAVILGYIALVASIATPASEFDLVDPRSALRSDRAAAMVMLAAALVLGAGLGILSDGIFGVPVIFLCFLILVLRSRWPEFAVAQICLALSGKLPYKLMHFLNHSHQQGTLRQVGGVYQLRHARLQEHLCNESV